MLVDDTGDNKTPRGIYCLIVGSTGLLFSFYNFFYFFTVNDKRAPEDPALIDDGTILN